MLLHQGGTTSEACCQMPTTGRFQSLQVGTHHTVSTEHFFQKPVYVCWHSVGLPLDDVGFVPMMLGAQRMPEASAILWHLHRQCFTPWPFQEKVVMALESACTIGDFDVQETNGLCFLLLVPWRRSAWACHTHKTPFCCSGGACTRGRRGEFVQSLINTPNGCGFCQLFTCSLTRI